MNGAQISAFFNKNKPLVLGTAAVGVTGLALLQRGKSTGGPGAPVAATVPGIPAAAVVPASAGGTYDSGSVDVYNALQPTLEAILQQGNRQTDASSGITAPPAAIASTLFSPTFSGNYVRFADGLVAEVQSDGSLYGMTAAEHKRAFASNGGDYKGLVNELETPRTGPVYSTVANLRNAAAADTRAS